MSTIILLTVGGAISVLLGVAGSMVGFWIASLLGLAPAATLKFLVALPAAFLLILILSKLGIFPKT